MTHYKEIKKQAREYYLQWMKEKTISKALGREVFITKKGWNHLLERGTKDRINRFKLIKSAKYIIKTSEKFTKTNVNGITYLILEGIAVNNGKKQKIKVILKEDKKGNVILYSVMKKA